MSNEYIINKVDATGIADIIREKGNITGELVWPEGWKTAIQDFSSLNFIVVDGTTQPENPKENTIWVNTSTIITNWTFSTKEPEVPEEGMVWFSTGMESALEFNALKKNELQVYPSLTKQYNDNMWDSVEASIYRDGEWKSFYDGVLCTSDNEFTQITGGWIADTQFTPWNDPDVATAPTVTKDHDSITLNMGLNQTGSYRTKNKIDVSKYTTLCVDVTSASCDNGYLMLFLMNSIGTGIVDNAAAWTILLGNGMQLFQGTKSIDLGSKSLSGEYYIGLSIRTYGTYPLTVDFTKIYLK